MLRCELTSHVVSRVTKHFGAPSQTSLKKGLSRAYIWSAIRILMVDYRLQLDRLRMKRTTLVLREVS